MDKFSLALVTGASSGIGEALSLLLASKGISLILSGRDEQRLLNVTKKIRDQYQVQVSLIFCELNDPEDRLKLIDAIHHHVPDLIINNAGFGLYGDALTHRTEDQLKILSVDGSALLELTLEGARTLILANKPGVILNVSSAAGFMPYPSFAVYAAAKAFVNSFSEAFDEEVRTNNVRVLAACPGMVATNFSVHAGSRNATQNRNPSMVMKSEFVAEEIWKQIVKEQKVKIINWKYRWMIFLIKYVLPKSLVLNKIRSVVKGRSSEKLLKKED